MESILKNEKKYSLEEYLSIEEKSEVKHEFRNGKYISKPDEALSHNLIVTSLCASLNNLVIASNKECYVLCSDMKVYIPRVNSWHYPDLCTLCGEPEFYMDDPTIISNPNLIAEVLSETSAEYDRTDKFADYCSIPSFREYLLVSQDRPFVEAFFLHDPENGLWKISSASGLNASIKLHSIDCTLKLKDIYRRAKNLKEAE